MSKESILYEFNPATGKHRLKPGGLPGMVRTPKKAASARENGAKNTKGGPGLTPVLLSEIECAIKASKAAGSPCPGGDSLTGHHWSCPRGQAIKRRQKEGRDVQTGLKSDA